MAAPDRRYSTGLTFLDSRLDGGIPIRRLLTLTAPAGSQSELLLYHLATTKPMLYVSTTNPAESELRTAIESTAVSDPLDLEFEHVTPQELLANTDEYLARIRPESFVVVDPIDGLERTEYDRYLSFINDLKRRLRETDSVGILHALDTDPMPESRRLTLKRTDYVWRLEELVHSRAIQNRLLVTKARGGRALTEPIPLVISDHVRVDTSRRIA